MAHTDQNQFNPVDHGDPMVSRILNAAETCVRRYGIRRTSMGEVARVGKLSRGSIYRYFDDKEALVESVFQRRQVEFLNKTEAALEKQKTLVDKLTLSVLQGRKDLQDGIFASLSQVEPETVALMFMDSRSYQRSVSFWPPHILAAQAAGEISADVPIATATDFIMRLATSMVMFPQMGLELKTQSEVRAYLQQVICRGLRG